MLTIPNTTNFVFSHPETLDKSILNCIESISIVPWLSSTLETMIFELKIYNKMLFVSVPHFTKYIFAQSARFYKEMTNDKNLGHIFYKNAIGGLKLLQVLASYGFTISSNYKDFEQQNLITVFKNEDETNKAYISLDHLRILNRSLAKSFEEDALLNSAIKEEDLQAVVILSFLIMDVIKEAVTKYKKEELLNAVEIDVPFDVFYEYQNVSFIKPQNHTMQ